VERFERPVVMGQGQVDRLVEIGKATLETGLGRIGPDLTGVPSMDQDARAHAELLLLWC
jgi:hypothetical protein